MTEPNSKYPETAAEEIAARIHVLRSRAEANRLNARDARHHAIEADEAAARFDAIADEYEQIVQ